MVPDPLPHSASQRLGRAITSPTRFVDYCTVAGMWIAAGSVGARGHRVPGGCAGAELRRAVATDPRLVGTGSWRALGRAVLVVH
jgi:hypothetical protein